MRKKSINFTLALISLSFIAKILSFLCRILLARELSAEAIQQYAILMPCIIILITFVQMGIPQVLSKMLAHKNYTSAMLSTSIYASVFTTSITSITFLFSIPFLTSILFKADYAYLFYCILPFLPLVALSGILKGYLFGKQYFLSSNFSQVIEELSRIVFLLLIFYVFELDPITLTKAAILSISVGELFSSLYMLIVIFIRKRKTRFVMRYDKTIAKEIAHHSLAMSTSRFIGSFTYFLEPIIMNLQSAHLLSTNLSSTYANINAYALPLLTLPSFISIALANYLLPSFTYHYSRGNKKYAYTLFFRITLFTLACCSIYSVILYYNVDSITQLLYESNASASILKLCIIPFILYSIQPILAIMLHAIGKVKQSALDTLYGCIVRLALVYFLSAHLQGMTLVIALLAGMLTTTLLHLLRVLIYFYKEKRLT